MKKSNLTNCAYTAGVIDSDGCIHIGKRKRGNSFAHNLSLHVNVVDGRMIDWLYGVWGGYVNKTPATGLGTVPVYRWELHGEKAAECIKKILPLLIYKKDQAVVAQRFHEICQHQKNNRRGHGRGNSLQPHELALRDECFEKMKQLKREFHESAAVTTKWKERDVSLVCDSLALTET